MDASRQATARDRGKTERRGAAAGMPINQLEPLTCLARAEGRLLKRPFLDAICFGFQGLYAHLRVQPKRAKDTRRGKIGSRYGENSKPFIPVRYLIIGLYRDDDEKYRQNKGNDCIEHDAPAIFSEKVDLE